jgi:hypothetical protein
MHYILAKDQKRYDYKEENNAQNYRDPEQCALDAAPGCEDAAGIGACQATQACAFALQDDAENQQDGDYNQRDI